MNMRLDKLMANLGYGSRKDIAIYAKYGRIAYHGSVLRDASKAISLDDVRRGLLTFDAEPVDPPPPLTVMLYKPAGFTCSHDEVGPLIYDLLPERWRMRKPALSAAGRLDKESTGQVILTDDGDMLHRIIHPKSHAAKHYHVTLEHTLSGNEAGLFASGEFLMQGDTKKLKPAEWTPLDAHSGHMVLQEGRYHQIRRMFETIGNKVLTLHRFQTGGLALNTEGDVHEGEHRILSPKDIGRLWE